MRNGCLALIIVTLLIFGCTIRSGKKDEGGDQEEGIKVENTATASQCESALGAINRAFPGPNFNNPKPGVFHLPPAVWAMASSKDREAVAQILAIQKGCKIDTNPNIVDVQIRSIEDNRLLASGKHWNLTDQ